ncbi:hypothetical protein F511_36425 [Dorcoceras hygrometricum]|uniref:Uncharacterized protein n=1 Tax=Dorcoceras hygrometricum TaxID=472368 RepID=A0A2Z7AWG9_9LAMI|nr:hypothetical protein F511_36425 [Dorcoceras hygrometricum]
MTSALLIEEAESSNDDVSRISNLQQNSATMTSAEFSNDDVSRISNLQQNSATMTSADSATLTVIFSNVNKQNSETLTGRIQQRSQQNSAMLFSNVYKQFSC